MAGKRLYLGRLPADIRSDDVKKHFEGFGTITECRVMTGFGFIEFENSRDAEDVVNNFHNKPFMGSNIVVEFAKESRRRDDRGDYGGRGPPPRRVEQRRPAGVRVNVSGISRDTSWQDLKDFGREAGNVTFADVERDAPGRGVLEYPTIEDAELAVGSLDGKDLRGVAVRLTLDDALATGGAMTGARGVAVARLFPAATRSAERIESIDATIVETNAEMSVGTSESDLIIGDMRTAPSARETKSAIGATEDGTLVDRRSHSFITS
ncbi:hypothetical protein FRB90_012110 [Tulasnella sp. 427]|nr:hypothetical protein FRB90_012110 [Tulasnella sp. 427]